jgi:hypothetical protein
MADVDISIGADTSAAQAGLAQLRNAGSSVMGEMSGMFASAFTIGGITGILSAAKGLVDRAHEIHHEADRFGLDAEQFQLIGNAAKQNGIDLGMTARAMNLLTINAQAALNPMSKQGQAMKDLGIDAREFAALNPADQFLTLADAYKNSAQDGAAYADVATLIGKRNTEMIPILAMGSAAIRDQSEAMGISSTKTIDNLDKMYVAIAQAGGQLKTLGTAGVGALGDFDKWILKVRSSLIDVLTPGIYKTIDAYKDLDKVVGVGTTRENPATDEGMTPTGGGFTGPGSINEYYDKLDAVEAKETAAYQAGLTKETLLAQKVKERADLQGELSTEVENESDQTDRALELRSQIADITKEIVPLQKQSADEAKRDADEVQKKADAAAKWLEDATKANDQELGNLAIMKLRASGQDELADALKTQLDYQEKINAAYADGNTELAKTLGQEAALAAQMAQQDINAKVAKQGMQQTTGLTGAGEFYGGGGGYAFDYMAQGLATDINTGAVDQDALMKYTAQAQIGALTGKEVFSFVQRAYARRSLMNQADKQTQSQLDEIEAQKQGGIEYLQGVMSGTIRPANQQEYLQGYSKAYGASLFSAGNLKQMFGTSVANIAGQSGANQVQTQLNLLQSQLDQLMSINKNLTPEPGY